MNKAKKEIELMSYEDILGTTSQIKEIKLTELHEFANHPFKVKEDQDFENLVESIKEYGVLTPGIARPRPNGGYELISGHRRKKASEKLGNETMPVIVADFSDDEAAILVVDSNIQRENLTHSEKAKAFQMKYEAIKHQGKKGTGSTLSIISDLLGEKAKTVQRYVQLARLNDSLLDKVDTKQISFSTGLELSFLTNVQQNMVSNVLEKTGLKLNQAKARKIREAAELNTLDESFTEELIDDKKHVQKIFFMMDYRKLQEYFGENFDEDRAGSVIYKLLDEWREKNQSSE